MRQGTRPPAVQMNLHPSSTGGNAAGIPQWSGKDGESGSDAACERCGGSLVGFSHLLASCPNAVTRMSHCAT